MQRFPRLEQRRWRLRLHIAEHEDMDRLVYTEEEAEQRRLGRELVASAYEELAELDFVLGYFEQRGGEWPVWARWVWMTLVGLSVGLGLVNIWMIF